MVYTGGNGGVERRGEVPTGTVLAIDRAAERAKKANLGWG